MENLFNWEKVHELPHWCLSKSFRIPIFNGEMVFNRLFGKGWSDLDDFSADPNNQQIFFAHFCQKAN